MVKAFLLSWGEHGWEREWVGTSSRNLAHRLDGRRLQCCCSLSVSVTVTRGRLVSDLLVAIVIFNPRVSFRLERHQPHLSPCNRAYNNGVGDVVVREVQTVSALVPEPFRAPKTQKKKSNNSRCCALNCGSRLGWSETHFATH